MAENEVNHALVGRCGLYCGACDIYRVFVDKKGERQKRMAEFFKCKPEQVRCQGCQRPTQDDWCLDCKIIKCLNKKGYAYCYECGMIITCDIYQELNKRYNNLPFENLKKLQADGEEKWLKEQICRWTCPQCGAPICYGEKECTTCNSDLTKIPDN